MSFLLHLSEKVNPFQSIIVLAAAIFILSFFVVSRSRATKNFLVVLVSISLIIAFYLNIYCFLSMGSFSSFLVFFGDLQVIEIGVVIFSALNLLYFIYIYHADSDNFGKILMILLFSAISAAFVILSKNFLLIFTSISVFILTVFQLVSVINSGVNKISLHVLEFFLRPVLTVVLFFFGFSLLYGVTDFKDFNQILQSEYISNPLIILVLIIFGVALYLYFFLFPFQGPYLRMLKKGSISTSSIIWFLYFPAGFFTLMKLGEIYVFFMTYSFFLGKDNMFISVFLIALTCFGILAANIGAFKTVSIRRIMSFLFLFFVSVILLNISMYSTGVIDIVSMNLFIFIDIFIILISYMPLCAIFYNVERNTGEDGINSLRGFGRNNIYAGINLVIIFLSWSGFLYYIKPFIGYFAKTDFSKMCLVNIILFITMISGFIFLSVNIFRILVYVFKKADPVTDRKILFSGSLYAYITFFSLVILVALLAGLLIILNVDVAFLDFSINGI
jgi:NADH:ubiquinone oxidoreductase subunit 2 (subunit N)